MKNYKCGVVSVSFRNHSPEEIIIATKNAGLSCIEWGSDIHAPYGDLVNLGELVKLQKMYDIKCSSYGTYFRIGETPIDELEGYIKAAKILGTDILRIWCGTKCGANMTDIEKSELLSLCCKASRIAEEQGVILCMECHRSTFTEDPRDAIWLIEKVNSKNFRMYWQPFQWQTADENVLNARKIAPYAEHIHVFNWKDDKKIPLSCAIDEWRKYLSEFSSPRTLLLEFMPCGTLEELKNEANALKIIVGDIL